MAGRSFGFKPKRHGRQPRLDTILMVEKAVYKNRSGKKAVEIWRGLPKKAMWPTFLTILDYLEYSGKIRVEKDRTISWIWSPKGVEEAKKKGLILK